MAQMRLIVRLAATTTLAISLVGTGCHAGSQWGGPAAISAFPNRSLTVKYDDHNGLIATLDYSDTVRCDILKNDAFASLNGRSVPVFPGSFQIIPAQSDDGGVICTHPSVTLTQIPSDLSPPWTIQIGDSTAVLAATFGPGPVNPFTVGPVTTSELTSSLDSLTVQIQRPAGTATPAFAQATLTSSDGQSSMSVGAVGQSSIVFANAIIPGWPPGPIAVQIKVDFYAENTLLSCQAPNCSLVQEPGICTPLASGPGMPGAGIPCSDLFASSTTNVFSIQLTCQPTNGVCS
jgi:hypothetical protein